MSLTAAAFVCILAISSLAQAQGQTAGAAMVISQIYTHGGESGAIYRNDFIELYNRSNSVVDISGWSLSATSHDGSTLLVSRTQFLSSQSVPIPPGVHLLIVFTPPGTNGQQLNGDVIFPFASLGATDGEIVLLGKDKTLPADCPASPDLTGTVIDYVGYGSAGCFEGTVAPAPTVAKSLTRVNGGCTDTNNNFADFSLADPNPRSQTSLIVQCGTPPSSFDFASTHFDALESDGAATITVTRTGDLTTAATVDYSTADETASERSDYTTAAGTLRFAPGESQKTFDVLITNDNVTEPDETVSLSLVHPAGNGTLGSRSSAQLIIHNDDPVTLGNVIDVSGGLVDQQYHDFLNRVPDGAGFQFWVNNIESCGSDLQCREVKRIDTSAAFFLSIEFQRTGFLVYRTYKAAFPDTVRPRGLPRYREFMRDTQEISRGVIVNSAGWDTLLESNTVAYFNSFVMRDDFLINFPLWFSAAQYVDTLNARIGGVLTTTERNNLVNGLESGPETRATVLRKIAENPTYSNAEFNRAFVLMQYFGYLRRNPDDLPNTDYSGFDFWLNKLNQFGDYRAAEMVKAFLSSDEYRKRFGQ